MWRDMKTTSHLGGRKAHTAMERRVRYETSTKLIDGRDGLSHMVQPLWHGPGRAFKRAGGDGPGTSPGPQRAARRVLVSWPPSTTAKYPTSVMSTAKRWNSPPAQGSVTAPRSAPVTSRAYLARTPVV